MPLLLSKSLRVLHEGFPLVNRWLTYGIYLGLNKEVYKIRIYTYILCK
jgi:hypothetical protein